MSNKEIELPEGTLPCPFCGQIPKLFEAPNCSGEIEYWIDCYNRHCKLSVTTQLQDSPKNAMKVWNQRV